MHSETGPSPLNQKQALTGKACSLQDRLSTHASCTRLPIADAAGVPNTLSLRLQPASKIGSSTLKPEASSDKQTSNGDYPAEQIDLQHVLQAVSHSATELLAWVGPTGIASRTSWLMSAPVLSATLSPVLSRVPQSTSAVVWLRLPTSRRKRSLMVAFA
jgi:hypothetical protein